MTDPILPGTRKHNRDVAEFLPLNDKAAFEDAQRGWCADLPGPVMTEDGRVAWDPSWFDFLDGPCPDSVNPSLWRHAQLNAIGGLFEVCDGVWQARRCDYANMTIIRGETGWILVDPLMSAETSAAALKLVNDTLGERPVSAILVTHCHPDHFAGLRGVARDDVPVIVPEGFMEYAASEGVLGAIQMQRRAMFQFGIGLPFGPEGLVDGGIGKTVTRGTRGFVRPTDEIRETGETHVIDGVNFEFLMASGTEAPAEFTFLLPDHGVLCMAEVCTMTMHNLLPPRGAEVRDALLWSRVIDEALVRFGARADVLVNSHNWPVWGQDALRTFLAEQRDIYKYTHDQTLRLANLGHGPDEIAALIAPPDWVSHTFHARGYYGSLSFNARATYQKYFGFYDGRPVNLDPLPPEELGQRYVVAMGGVDKVLTLAQQAVYADKLQWAATLLNHVLFAGADDGRAAAMLAQVHRNQGYREESGIMRNVYLRAAMELENGVTPIPAAGGRNADLAAELDLTAWFDALALRLNPERARGVTLNLRFVVGEAVVQVSVARQTEFARIGAEPTDCAAIVTASLAELEQMAGTLTLDTLQIDGDRDAVRRWLELHDTFDLWFNLVTP